MQARIEYAKGQIKILKTIDKALEVNYNIRARAGFHYKFWELPEKQKKIFKKIDSDIDEDKHKLISLNNYYQKINHKYADITEFLVHYVGAYYYKRKAVPKQLDKNQEQRLQTAVKKIIKEREDYTTYWENRLEKYNKNYRDRMEKYNKSWKQSYY